jgi:hypothetical protein
VQLISATGEAPDFNLTPVELFLANDAKALIIERTPAPELVLGAHDRQSLVGFEMNIHLRRRTAWLIGANAQSGRRMIV